jgi:sortase (surface protein transpeptidase)
MSDEKKNLNATDGIADLLGMNKTSGSQLGDDAKQGIASNSEPAASDFAEKTAPAPADLPIAKDSNLPTELKPVVGPPETPEEAAKELHLEADELKAMPDLSQPPKSNGLARKVKTILPYLAIFLIGLGLFFFYFNDFSFRNLLNPALLRIESVTEDDRDKNLEQLKADVESDYNVWIRQFFVDVNDQSIISMDTDVSGNGLSNLEKYLLNLNPKVYSTQGNIGDGQLVLNGINPWTGKPFTDRQKVLIDRYIYQELISNRITAAAITRGVTKFSQYVTEDSPYYIDPATLQEIGNDPSLVVNVPNGSGGSSAPPSNPVPAPNTIRPEQAIDTSKPGLLEIPANRISVPIIWTKEVKDFDADLKKGIVHYPGTAMPGEVGLAYLSGHSSGYAWDRSPYKQVFASLGGVADGTSFTITATQNNGQTVKFHYVVSGRGEYAANDQAQFVSTADSQVALSTCWPVGTVARRLVLYSKLTQTER